MKSVGAMDVKKAPHTEDAQQNDPELQFDKFEFDLDLCDDDLGMPCASEFGDEKARGIPKVPKNDIRRHIPKMFLNAINCGEFPTILGYLTTLMLPNAVWSYEHVLKTKRRTIMRKMTSEGPRLSAYYITALNVMFPDMMIEFTSCKLVTSNMWEGSQLLIEGDFQCSQIYDVSLQRSGLLISRLYHKRSVQIWECMEQLSLRGDDQNSSDDGGDNHSAAEGSTNSCSDTQSTHTTHSTQQQSNSPVPMPPLSPRLDDPLLPPVTSGTAEKEEETAAAAAAAEQRKRRRKFPKPAPDATDARAMIQQVQEMFLKSPLLSVPRKIRTSCSFVFRLDARHMIEAIDLVATEDLTASVRSAPAEADNAAASTASTAATFAAAPAVAVPASAASAGEGIAGVAERVEEADMLDMRP